MCFCRCVSRALRLHFYDARLTQSEARVIGIGGTQPLQRTFSQSCARFRNTREHTVAALTDKHAVHRAGAGTIVLRPVVLAPPAGSLSAPIRSRLLSRAATCRRRWRTVIYCINDELNRTSEALRISRRNCPFRKTLTGLPMLILDDTRMIFPIHGLGGPNFVAVVLYGNAAPVLASSSIPPDTAAVKERGRSAFYVRHIRKRAPPVLFVSPSSGHAPGSVQSR